MVFVKSEMHIEQLFHFNDKIKKLLSIYNAIQFMLNQQLQNKIRPFFLMYSKEHQNELPEIYALAKFLLNKQHCEVR